MFRRDKCIIFVSRPQGLPMIIQYKYKSIVTRDETKN